MKTPREFLLKKHAAAEPKLEAISRGVRRHMKPAGMEARGWLDWMWPSPFAWGAVAATWLVIIGFNVASAELRPQRHVIEAKRSPEMLQALREQRKLFVELMTPMIPDANRARFAPHPRSETEQNFAMA